MTWQEWLNKYLGKATDYDGVAGAQCVDAAKTFIRYVCGVTPGSWGDAHAYFDNFYSIPGLYNNFTRITNTPSFVPQKGDIMVFKKTSRLPYGHIVICDGDANTSYFHSYEQNWDGKAMKRVKHDYVTYPVLGVLRPKNQANITGKTGSGSNVANSTNTNYKVRVTCERLNVRAGAGTQYRINTVVKRNEIYTIVETFGGWGKLKSGAGWISLTYTTRV